MSEGTLARLGKMHTMVLHTVEDAIRALVDGDRELAARVLAAKGTVAEMAYELEHHLAERLTADAPNRLHAFRLETDVIENLRRVTYFARRIAKIVTTSPE